MNIVTDFKPQSPYVGLIPYSPRDSNFFFGRETETEIISANLRSARLTVLHGMSGVGKSSVLQAGVVHNLRELAAQDLATYGQAEFAVIYFSNWAGDPLKGIADAVRAAVAESLGIKYEMLEPLPETEDLVELLEGWSNRYSLELLIILDQFEELFNYLNVEHSMCKRFAKQFTKACNAKELSVRFLISLRGDTLSLLDYFKEDIPCLLDNRLQLHHLAAPDAGRAITEPIKAYNNLYKPIPPYEIEPGLVDEVINQVKLGRVEDGINSNYVAATAGNVDVQTTDENKSSQIFVETPYLQLVLKRIWREETQVGSNHLQLDTLVKKLGGASKIIQSHLDEVMNSLNDEERKIASKCFKYLVTPMGTKVALTPNALAKYTEWDEETIKAVLETLIKGKESMSKSLDINLPVSEQKASITDQPPDEARIFRTVEIPVGKEKLQGYEVTHDALVPAIMDWRSRYEIEHSVGNQVKSIAKIALPILAGVGIAILFSFALWRSYVNAEFETLKDTTTNVEVNSNKLIRENDNLEKVIIEKVTENNVIKEKEDTTNSPYKELTKILINLSGSSTIQRDSAIKDLKKMIEEGKVPKEYESSLIQLVAKIDDQKADELRNAVINANINPPKLSEKKEPRIYIQITDENQRGSVQNYKKLLQSNNYKVPDIENVGNIKLSNTQLRYFRRSDEPLAQKVAKLLMKDGIKNIQVQYISGYESSTAMRPQHLELWFANDAFGYKNDSLKN